MRLLFSIPMDNGPRPAIFLDRDGVINERILNGYVRTWEDFKFVDGISDAVASWAHLGLPIIVVSNQACVGKGLIDAPYLQEITRRFVAELAAAGARVDAVYYCPHRSDEHCECRKPRPGLLREASRDWHIDLSQSVLVGDSTRYLDDPKPDIFFRFDRCFKAKRAAAEERERHRRKARWYLVSETGGLFVWLSIGENAYWYSSSPIMPSGRFRK